MSHAFLTWLPGATEADSRGLIKEKIPLPQEITEKKHQGLSISYCPGSRPLSLLGLFVEGRERGRGEDSRHGVDNPPAIPLPQCLPIWAAGQVHLTGEGGQVHKTRTHWPVPEPELTSLPLGAHDPPRIQKRKEDA